MTMRTSGTQMSRMLTDDAAIVCCLLPIMYRRFGDVNAGEMVTKQPGIFFWIYVPYLIFPAVVVARVWRDKPFSRPLPATLDTVLQAVSAATFALFFGAGIYWALKCEIPANGDANCPVDRL